MTPNDVPVGKRIIYTEDGCFRERPYEAKVVEWSPSGKRVKLDNGTAHWLSERDTERAVVLEILP